MNRTRPIDVVTFGGGGGHAQILGGLKRLPNVRITAVCPSTDSGGSTGILTRDYRTPGYVGDLTKCIAALCPDPALARALMHRFSGGVLHGHSLKNILLVGLRQAGGTAQALEQMYGIARIEPHRVIPATEHSTELRARLRLGNIVRGETNIDLIARNPLWHPETHAIESVSLKPSVAASPTVIAAIKRAKLCVLCPGDLYSSLLPTLLPRGVRTALRASKAKLVAILNIMTKQGETNGYRAEDFIARIEEYAGRPCDHILVNNAPLPRRTALAYALEEKVQLTTKHLRKDPRVRAFPCARLTPEGFAYHDGTAVARALARLLR